MFYRSTLFLFFFHFINTLQAQIPADQKSSSEILSDLQKLNVLGNALYVAAHPDDENTRLISYLAKQRLYNTSYLSLTRGDGGQNLIGSEQGDLLGLIRTHELLEARNIDGGKQFFSRAKDFGFSKNPEETFTIWDKEKILSDAVWVIRNTKPDVIITRFSPEPAKTHGHHTASAIIAIEAFEAAGDSTKFPEQLKYVKVWKPKSVLWNTGRYFYDSEEKLKAASLLTLDVGTYIPLIGKSAGEISSISRTMHKSQGFGTTLHRGVSIEYFQHLKGEKPVTDIFNNVNTTWSRIPGTRDIQKSIDKIIQNFNPSAPSLSVPALVALYKRIETLPDPFWKEKKTEEVKSIIKSCLGMYAEATLSDHLVTPGEKVKFNFNFIYRSEVAVTLKSLKLLPAGIDSSLNFTGNNQLLTVSANYQIPETATFTHPFWLQEQSEKGMFIISDPTKVDDPENIPDFKLNYTVSLLGVSFSFMEPVIFKTTNPVDGDVFKNIHVVPPVSVNFANNLYIFPDSSPKTVVFHVLSNKDNTKGKLKITAPQGWTLDKDTFLFELSQKGQQKKFEVTIKPSRATSDGNLTISSVVDGKEFNKGNIVIDYNHIGTHILQPATSASLVNVNLLKKGVNIGYIKGAGDNVTSVLEQIGYNITNLDDNEIVLENIKHFDAVLVGIRAYNTNERMKVHQPELMKYVEQGGTVIVQYNTSHGMKVENPAPYELKLSNERVTVENAPVKILKPKHPLLNAPNVITSSDFEGWVQERGLYFPNQWGKEFEALLSTADPGEPDREGGLLVAKYGKGNYIYTGYSWFRQLPAGVPGAIKIFVNLISAGSNK